MQQIQLVVGAGVSLLVLVVVVGLLIERAPLLFVARSLPEKIFGGADEGGEVVGDDDGPVARTGVEVGGGDGPPGERETPTGSEPGEGTDRDGTGPP
jgi:hypothetical protein